MGKKTNIDMLEEIGIDAICARIANTESQRQIAVSLGIDPAALVRWLQSDAEKATKAQAAREHSAFVCDDLALQALEEIESDSTQAHVARQREIASHQRWRAKTRNKVFSDRVQTESTIDLRVKSASELSDDELAAIALQYAAKQAE
jgi:hypothetical protein